MGFQLIEINSIFKSGILKKCRKQSAIFLVENFSGGTISTNFSLPMCVCVFYTIRFPILTCYLVVFFSFDFGSLVCSFSFHPIHGSFLFFHFIFGCQLNLFALVHVTKYVMWFQWLRFNSFHSVCQFDFKWRMGSILVHSLTHNVLVHMCVCVYECVLFVLLFLLFIEYYLCIVI